MNANDFVVWALKSPLHAIMGPTMLVTVTGRKTGRKITLPVNYDRAGDDLWILSSRDRAWWRNLLHGGEVDIHLHGRDYKGLGEVIQDEPAVSAQLSQYVHRLPGSARYVGVRLENGGPNCDDLARISKERLFVHICLQQ